MPYILVKPMDDVRTPPQMAWFKHWNSISFHIPLEIEKKGVYLVESGVEQGEGEKGHSGSHKQFSRVLEILCHNRAAKSSTALKQ